MTAPAPEPRNIVIVGGGIIGACTAYFLTRHPRFNPATHSITLVEAVHVAAGASGKSGGLLAKWAYPSCLVPLSFRLHARLAEEHGGARRWGYRLVEAGELGAKARKLPAGSAGDASAHQESDSLGKRRGRDKTLAAAGVPEDLQWLAPGVATYYETMSPPGATAQVHPEQFTRSMADLAQEKGVALVHGFVTALDTVDGKISGITYTDPSNKEEKRLAADTVILTAGPWTRAIYPLAPIHGTRAHSVVIRPAHPLSAHAVFTHIQLPAGAAGAQRATTVTPEIYCRPDGTAYVSGAGDNIVTLPPTADEVAVDPGRCRDIVEQVGAISDELREGEVVARQACYLPVSDTGSGPYIGTTSVEGLVLAAGHTCWGIQNAPGTGLCVSELVLDGKVRSANIDSLAPVKAGM